jgi:Dna[CI] antecedent, DciA
MESWPEIVGTLLARRTRPLRLAGHRLFVMCHGSSLRQELTFHKREILRKFNSLVGMPGVAREIVFLESDANLTSLVKDTLEQEWKRRVRDDAAERARFGERAPEEEPESGDARIAAAYPRFDGQAYREEMAKIQSEAVNRTSPITGAERES